MVNPCSHYWFMAQAKSAFEPVKVVYDNQTHYVMVEYAYLICTKCGIAKKTKVKSDDPKAQ